MNAITSTQFPKNMHRISFCTEVHAAQGTFGCFQTANIHTNSERFVAILSFIAGIHLYRGRGRKSTK